MDWVLVIVFSLATGGYQILDEQVGSREACAHAAQLAYTTLDTPEKLVVATDCYRKSWPERVRRM